MKTSVAKLYFADAFLAERRADGKVFRLSARQELLAENLGVSAACATQTLLLGTQKQLLAVQQNPLSPT